MDNKNIEQALNEEYFKQNPKSAEESKLETFSLIDFHKKWLKFIKKSLGKKCSYISHLKEKKGYFIKVIIINKHGKKDKIVYKLEIDPNNLKGDDYRKLIQLIKNKDYEEQSS